MGALLEELAEGPAARSGTKGDATRALREAFLEATASSDSRAWVEALREQVSRLIDAELGELEIASTFACASHPLDEVSTAEYIVRRPQEGTHTTVSMETPKSLFRDLSRVASTVARDARKMVDVRILGEECPISPAIAAMIDLPLVQLLRAAIEGSIETEEDRARVQKSEVATVRVEATFRGGQTTFTVADDGQGLSQQGKEAVALAKVAVGTIGGRLDVRSRQGVGTRVRLIFPQNTAKPGGPDTGEEGERCANDLDLGAIVMLREFA